jgi:hypothetical protein
MIFGAMDRNLKYIGFIIGAAFVLSLPLLFYGFPFHSSDGVQHAIFYGYFSSQLWAGEFYPRWLMRMNGGLGAPALFYYPPIPYYLTAPGKPFFAGDSQGWHQLGVSASLALAASGVCAYLWLKKINTERAALIAAVIYVVMPYHLATDVYDRGAFAELWTFVWMPLILLFTEAISRGRKTAALGLVISYALLIMTHLPTTLMFSAVPICYGCYMAAPGRRIRVTGIIIGAMSLGIGLSAIYLLPALAMQKYVFMEELKVGFQSYEHWFLPFERGWINATSNTIAQIVPQVATLGLFAYLLARRNSDSTARKRAAFWMLVLLISVFMMASLSSFVWRLITPLHMIQFPFRFNTVLCVATTALVALGISSIKKYSPSASLIRWLALLMIVGWIGYAAVWARNAYAINDPSHAMIYKRNARQERVGADVNEFRPRWVVSIQEPVLESLLGRIGESADGLTKVNIVEGTGTVEVKSWKPREILLQVETPGGAVLDVSQFYFPGWTAYTSNGLCLSVQPSKPGGLLRVAVPAGSHQILLRLNQTLPEYAGWLISAFSASLLLLIVGLSGAWRKYTWRPILDRESLNQRFSKIKALALSLTRRRPWVREFLIFFSFVVLAILMTWPWINYLRDACSDPGDPYFTSYILWWDYHQTFHDPLNLFQATIFYPYKYTLAFSEHHYGIALFFFPLFAVGLRPLTVHAIASLCAFAFSGYGMFRLARTLTESNGAAWVAGVIFAFIPYRFHQLAHLAYMFAGWIPLTLEALVLFLRKPGRMRAFWFGTAFFMNALACIHWGILTAMPLALSAAFLLYRHKRWRDVIFWRRGVIALGIASILLIPFLYPYVRVAKLYNFVRNIEEVQQYSANPIHWLVADDRNKLWGNLNARAGINEKALFPGLLPLLLALAAIFFVEPAFRRDGSSGGGPAPSRRILLFLDVFTIVSAILILVTTGFATTSSPLLILRLLQLSSPRIPFILFVVALAVRLSLAFPEVFRHIRRQNLLASLRAYRRPDAFWLGLTWSLTGFCGSLGMNFFFHRGLYEYVPLYRSIRVPARWAMIAYVGLALLAGLGAQASVALLSRHWKAVRHTAAYAVIVVAVLLELRAAPLVLIRGAVFPEEVTLMLKEIPMAGGIVELPVAVGDANTTYVLRAADHGRPLVTAYSGFFPPLEVQIENLTRQKPIPDTLIDLLESIPTSYLVVHNARLQPESHEQIANVLGRTVATGRLRLIRRFSNGDDIFAVTKTEPQAASEFDVFSNALVSPQARRK